MLKKIETPVTIRPATRADCRAICRMIEELAKHNGDTPLISEDALRSTAFGSDPWLHLLVAVRHERPVGYAGLQRSFNLQFGKRILDLHHLYVTPELRSRGIGGKLIRACEDVAQNMECSDLTVSTGMTNTSAQKAYFSYGFSFKPASNAVNFKKSVA